MQGSFVAQGKTMTSKETPETGKALRAVAPIAKQAVCVTAIWRCMKAARTVG